jgi:hypothetical protein
MMRHKRLVLVLVVVLVLDLGWSRSLRGTSDRAWGMDGTYGTNVN